MKEKPAARRRFARVYYDDLERDHRATFYDPTALSTWLRLLILSEKAWPAMPQLPRAARRADLETLRKDGLLIEVDNGGFELQGWRKERAKRAAVGLGAVEARRDRLTETPTDIPTNVEIVVPNNDVPAHARISLSASISSSTEGVQGEPDAAVAFHQRTGQFPGPRILDWLKELGDELGEARLASKIGAVPLDGRKVPEYLRAVRDLIRSEDYSAAKDRPRRPRLVKPKADPDVVRAELRRLYAEGAS